MPRSGPRVRVPSRALIKLYIADVFRIGNTTTCASGSVGGARPCQGRGRGFESRLALFLYTKGILKGYLLYINESCRTRTVRIFVPLRSVLTEVQWTSSTPSRAMKDSAGLERSRSPLCSGRCRTDIHRMSCPVSRNEGLRRTRTVRIFVPLRSGQDCVFLVL